jgi:hypothetical protein
MRAGSSYALCFECGEVQYVRRKALGRLFLNCGHRRPVDPKDREQHEAENLFKEVKAPLTQNFYEETQ